MGLSMRHCVIYEVPDTFALPDDIPFGQFEGLVSCRLILKPSPPAAPADGKGGGQVSKHLCLETVWKNRSAFADWATAFLNWLYHATKVNLHEPNESIEEKQSRTASDVRRWYKDPKNWWLVVANAGTVVAFLQLLQLQYDWSFASPDVTLLNPNQHLEAFEGEFVDFDLTIRNAAPRGSVLVRVDKLELQATDPAIAERNVTFFDHESRFVIPQLASGTSMTLPVHWTAAGPGSYRVGLYLTAEGGPFRARSASGFIGRRLATRTGQADFCHRDNEKFPRRRPRDRRGRVVCAHRSEEIDRLVWTVARWSQSDRDAVAARRNDSRS